MGFEEKITIFLIYVPYRFVIYPHALKVTQVFFKVQGSEAVNYKRDFKTHIEIKEQHLTYFFHLAAEE